MSNKKKNSVPKVGLLPPIKSTSKCYLTVDCRDIYKDPKKSREVCLIFSIRDNKLLAKIDKSNVEVGRIDQIRLDEYCMEMNERPINVWSNYRDLYRVSLDKQVITDIYDKKWCLTLEDLSLIHGYLLYIEHKAFYNLCLCDFIEIPNEFREENRGGMDYDFIAVENKNVYPFCAYKIEIK